MVIASDSDRWLRRSSIKDNRRRDEPRTDKPVEEGQMRIVLINKEYICIYIYMESGDK